MTDGPDAGPDSGNRISLGRIEITNLVLSVLAGALLWLLWGPARGLAAAAGGLLVAASLRTVAVVMGRILAPGRKGLWPAVIFWLKYTLVIAAVGVLVLKFEIDIPGFLVGVSLMVPAIVFEAVRSWAAREEGKP